MAGATRRRQRWAQPPQWRPRRPALARRWLFFVFPNAQRRRLDEDDETWKRVMSGMTFRGLEIWDLGIMARVGVRKVGEIDGLD